MVVSTAYHTMKILFAGKKDDILEESNDADILFESQESQYTDLMKYFILPLTVA